MKILEGKDVLRSIREGDCGSVVNIKCPYCDGNYTHIRHVGTLVGHDKLEAVSSYDGTFTTGATPSRRSALEVVFDCEECPGRPFSIVIQQHKGINYVQIHIDIDFHGVGG